MGFADRYNYPGHREGECMAPHMNGGSRGGNRGGSSFLFFQILFPFFFSGRDSEPRSGTMRNTEEAV